MSDTRPEATPRPLLEAIAGLPRMAGTLETALPLALEIACAGTPFALGRARVHGRPGTRTASTDPSPSEDWFATLPERRVAAVRKAGTATPLPAGLGGESRLRIVRLSGTCPGEVESAARRAGLRWAVAMDVLAEGRVSASLQLFSEAALEEESELVGALRLLLGQLEQIATRARLRAAVQTAARHARGQAAELESLASRLEIREAQLENVRTELAELEAERELRKYREAREPFRSVPELHGDIRPYRDDADSRGDPARGAAAGPGENAGRSAASASGPAPTDAPPAALPAGQPLTRAALRDLLIDARTDLPRQPILEDRIEQAIRRRQRSPKHLFAVLAVAADGLDRVALEVDSQGLDVVVTAMARRIVGQVRDADTVAHLDEATFVVVLEEIRVLDEAVRVAERIVKELQRPIWAGSHEARLGVRVGIVFGGPAYDRAQPVMRDAVSALARAEPREAPVAVFDEAAQHEEEIRRRIEVELGAALAADQLYLEYQPIVSLTDGRIRGIETFLRWKHPEHGMIPPDQFIPVAAASPMIHDLGVFLLERTCEQVRRWQEALGRTIPTIDINVTARQLFHERTAARVREIVARFGLDPGQFRFDISEADLMKDPVRSAAALERVRALGCRIAIDDFGTGFSSLKHLHALPIDAVKIDRSFVSGTDGKGNLSVARTIVELARYLDAEVIAEGVETRDQFRVLRSMGCGQAQGYLFSPPVAPSKLGELLREGYPIETGA